MSLSGTSFPKIDESQTCMISYLPRRDRRSWGWAVRGVVEVLANGLRDPESVITSTRECKISDFRERASGNPPIVTVNWPSHVTIRAASTVQQSRERDRITVRVGLHPLKCARPMKNDWVSALVGTFQLVMLVLLLTGQIR